MVVVVVYSGSRVRVCRGVLKVYSGSGCVEYPVSELESLVIVGRGVSLSSGVLLYLSRLDIPVVIHDVDCDVFLYRPFSVGTASTRRAQYYVSSCPERALPYARAFIEGKLRGFLNILRYYSSRSYVGCRGESEYTSCELVELSSRLEEELSELSKPRSISELRVYEAKCSQIFWRAISVKFEKYGFPGRIPRGKDPVNRVIDYAYSLLYGIILHAIVSAGLDPYAGFMHSERSGRPSLVYDFSEMYKPAIVHSITYIASKGVELELRDDGLLTPKTLAYVSKTVLSWIKKYRRKMRCSIRDTVYSKARELASSLRMDAVFTPFIYRVW